MKQKIKQLSSNNKLSFIVVATVLLTAFIVGVSVHFWQQSSPGTDKQDLLQRVISQENQLRELQNQYQTLKETKSESNDDAYSNSYNLTNYVCTIDQCLFNNIGDEPLGVAVIKGYYSPVERTAWEETKTCDGFTITSGSAELIRVMIDLVNEGNSIYSKNQLNQPVVNLGLQLLSQSERQSILNSTANSQIELIILMNSPTELEPQVCYTDMTVLRKK